MGPSLETSYHTESFSPTARQLCSPPCNAEEREQLESLCRLSQKTCLEGRTCAWPAASHLLNTPALFPSIPPGRGESVNGQMRGCTFGGSYFSKSAGINIGSSNFLFLLLWEEGYFTLHRAYCLVISSSSLQSRDLWRDGQVVPKYVL